MVPADSSLEGIATSSIYGELILCPAQSTYTELSHLRHTAMLLGRFYILSLTYMGVKQIQRSKATFAQVVGFRFKPRLEGF